MTSIPSLASKTIALSLLSGLRGKDTTSPDAQDDALGKPAGPWAAATGLSSVLSPKVRAELMKAGQAGGKDPLADNWRANLEQDSSGDALIDRVAKLQFSIRSTDIPAEDQTHLRNAGDTQIRLSTPQLRQEEFEEFILRFYNKYGDLSTEAYEGFQKSLADGTLKIHRAIDVDGLNYVSHAYDIYQDGHRTGSQGWGSHNKDYVRSIEAQGMKTAMGDFLGQRFFITWPDPAAKTA